MFSFLKPNPLTQLEKKRTRLLEEAMHVQRSGNLRLYAQKVEAIAALEKQIDVLRAQTSKSR
jgi:hypothetical protein